MHTHAHACMRGHQTSGTPIAHGARCSFSLSRPESVRCALHVRYQHVQTHSNNILQSSADACALALVMRVRMLAASERASIAPRFICY